MVRTHGSAAGTACRGSSAPAACCRPAAGPVAPPPPTHACIAVLPDAEERRVGTVGRIHPHLEARVVDPQTGRMLPRGQVRWAAAKLAAAAQLGGARPPACAPRSMHAAASQFQRKAWPEPAPASPSSPHMQVGELCVRGYSVMLGYWGDPAATARSVDEVSRSRLLRSFAAHPRCRLRRTGAAGRAPTAAPPARLVLPQGRWMHTGDLAVLDAHGYCSIVGRSKDMVIRGGENIYPVRHTPAGQRLPPAAPAPPYPLLRLHLPACLRSAGSCGAGSLLVCMGGHRLLRCAAQPSAQPPRPSTLPAPPLPSRVAVARGGRISAPPPHSGRCAGRGVRHTCVVPGRGGGQCRGCVAAHHSRVHACVDTCTCCLPPPPSPQVFGVPDAKYGEEVCAWVRLRCGGQGPHLAAAGRPCCQ